jgi:hypothetical protein
MLYAYYKSMKMCIFEVVSHSVDIVNYLDSMWRVFLRQVPICQIVLLLSFWILFVRYFLGRVFLKCGLLHQSWKTICFKLS